MVVLLVSFLFNGFVNGIQPHLQATTQGFAAHSISLHGLFPVSTNIANFLNAT